MTEKRCHSLHCPRFGMLLATLLQASTTCVSNESAPIDITWLACRANEMVKGCTEPLSPSAASHASGATVAFTPDSYLVSYKFARSLRSIPRQRILLICIIKDITTHTRKREKKENEQKQTHQIRTSRRDGRKQSSSRARRQRRCASASARGALGCGAHAPSPSRG